MSRFSPLFSWHYHYTTTDISHMRCTCHLSQVHHQGVEVTGPPPLGSERHHRDVSLPLLQSRAVARGGAAPAPLMVTRPQGQGEPGGWPPAVPIHLPTSGGAGAVGVVTPSVTILAWVYLKSLELK